MDIKEHFCKVTFGNALFEFLYILSINTIFVINFCDSMMRNDNFTSIKI